MTVSRESNMVSDRFRVFPQSLLVLLCSHWIRRTCLKESPSLSHFRAELSILLVKSCSLGERFRISALLGAKHFFETHVIPLVSIDFFPFSTLTSFFGAQKFLVYLHHHYGGFRIRGLQLGQNSQNVSQLFIFRLDDASVDVINPSSNIFLPRLRQLKIGHFSHTETFDSFCKFLLVNSTIEEIDIQLTLQAPSSALEQVFLGNNTLKRVKLTTPSFSFYTQTLFEAFSKNTGIKTLDLSDFIGVPSSVLCVLLTTTTLAGLVFPRNSRLDSTVFEALQKNSSLQEIMFWDKQFRSIDLANVIRHNHFLKKIEITHNFSKLSPLFHSLATNNSLVELIVHDPLKDSNSKTGTSEVVRKALSRNNSLLVLSLDLNLTRRELGTILAGIECNTTLKVVNFKPITLDLFSLVKYLQVCFNSNHLIMNVDILPHVVNFEDGLFYFDHVRSAPIVAEDVSALGSWFMNTCFNVKQLIFKKCSFTDESIAVLSDLIKVTHSLNLIDFGDCQISNSGFSTITHALPCSTSIKTVVLNNQFIDLHDLLLIFEVVSTGSIETIRIIDGFNCHVIDTENGVFVLPAPFQSKLLLKKFRI
ncbi:hypothetical protein GEMRC1_013348 [Eukaryota sp. GEM-RC1]